MRLIEIKVLTWQLRDLSFLIDITVYHIKQRTSRSREIQHETGVVIIEDVAGWTCSCKTGEEKTVDRHGPKYIYTSPAQDYLTY